MPRRVNDSVTYDADNSNKIAEISYQVILSWTKDWTDIDFNGWMLLYDTHILGVPISNLV